MQCYASVMAVLWQCYNGENNDQSQVLEYPQQSHLKGSKSLDNGAG